MQNTSQDQMKNIESRFEQLNNPTLFVQPLMDQSSGIKEDENDDLTETEIKRSYPLDDGEEGLEEEYLKSSS
jgi:hypothetical protein